MNFKDVGTILANAWAEYSPTMIGHLLLALVLGIYVLDPVGSFPLREFWPSIKLAADRLIFESGVKIERGYLIALLIYLYLWLFGRVSYAVGRLLRLESSTYYAPTARCLSQLSRHTAPVGRLSRLYEETLALWDRQLLLRGYGETGTTWTRERVHLWARYQRFASLAALFLVAWRLEGGSGSLDPGRITDVALLCIALAVISAWKDRVWSRRNMEQWASNVVEQLEKESTSAPPWDQGVARNAEFVKVMHNHIHAQSLHAGRWVSHRVLNLPLPGMIRYWLYRKLPNSRLAHWSGDDWSLWNSAHARPFIHDATIPPELRTQPFAKRFDRLLHCEGSGLAILVDPRHAYAPGVTGAGQSYCLGERQHGGRALSMYLMQTESDHTGDICFNAAGGLAWLVVADVGPIPIELLAQGAATHWDNSDKELAEWSRDLPLWQAMTRLSCADTSNWTYQMVRRRDVKVAGVELRSSTEPKAGHSYVVRGRLASVDLEFSFALQVFATPDRGKLLIAWVFLHLYGKPSMPPAVRPWWNWKSWAEYFGNVPGVPKG